jgi:hypothetical protein
MQYVVVVTSLECDPYVYGPFATRAEAETSRLEAVKRFADDADEGDDWQFQVVDLLSPARLK